MNNMLSVEIEAMLPALRRFARSLTRDTVRADDLVQDTVERALRRIDTFHKGSNLKAWMFTILRNQFITECRRPKVFDDSVEVGTDDFEMPVSGAQEDTVELKEFMAAFDRLNRSDQEILLLAGLEDMPYTEIAEIQDVAVGTIKSRVARARERLREEQSAGEGRRMPQAFISAGRRIGRAAGHVARVAM